MFKNFITATGEMTGMCVKWVRKLPGLVRVVVLDPNDKSRAFVVLYSERKRSYDAICFDIENGQICWQTPVINGGYGAPTIAGDAFILPTNFKDIIALSKEDGSVLWSIETDCRIRSSMNFVEDFIYFSSGGSVYKISQQGKVENKWSIEGAFFYGSVDVIEGLTVTLGTLEDVNGVSTSKVFAFHPSGDIAYSTPISQSPVISSDTSGISWKNSKGFVGGDDKIVCFDAKNGNILWTKNVEGFAGRHICNVDEYRVYYTTLKGVIGALGITTGQQVWDMHVKDASITAPMSIKGDYVIALVDAHLTILKSENGQFIKSIPIGHCPYSMATLNEDLCFVGAGEPPHNGLLISFAFKHSPPTEEFQCHVQTFNAFIEADYFNITIQITGTVQEIDSLTIDASLFGKDKPVSGEKIDSKTFVFRLPVPQTMCSGDYVFPLNLIISPHETYTRTACISLQRRSPLPKKVSLDFIPEFTQEKPTYSGAAIGAILKNLHGVSIKQSDIREMVDFSLEKSRYEPFQIWRIILRRILTSQATSKDSLPEHSSLENGA